MSEETIANGLMQYLSAEERCGGCVPIRKLSSLRGYLDLGSEIVYHIGSLNIESLYGANISDILTRVASSFR